MRLDDALAEAAVATMTGGGGWGLAGGGTPTAAAGLHHEGSMGGAQSQQAGGHLQDRARNFDVFSSKQGMCCRTSWVDDMCHS